MNLLYCSYYWSHIIRAVLRGKPGEISKVLKQETHLREPNVRAFSFSSFFPLQFHHFSTSALFC